MMLRSRGGVFELKRGVWICLLIGPPGTALGICEGCDTNCFTTIRPKEERIFDEDGHVYVTETESTLFVQMCLMYVQLQRKREVDRKEKGGDLIICHGDIHYNMTEQELAEAERFGRWARDSCGFFVGGTTASRCVFPEQDAPISALAKPSETDVVQPTAKQIEYFRKQLRDLIAMHTRGSTLSF